MRTYKVTFEDGNTITTGMNATMDEATAYYMGQSFEFDDTKPMVKAVKVECQHANIDEYFGKCDECGADVPFDPYNCDFNNPASAHHY